MTLRQPSKSNGYKLLCMQTIYVALTTGRWRSCTHHD